MTSDDKKSLLLGALAGMVRAARRRNIHLSGREVLKLLGGDMLKIIIFGLNRLRKNRGDSLA